MPLNHYDALNVGISGNTKKNAGPPHKCAVCAANNETDICLRKLKEGRQVTAKCPKCNSNLIMHGILDAHKD